MRSSKKLTVNSHAATLLSILALASCSEGGTTVLPLDADVTPKADATPQRVCTLIESSYPDLGAVTGTATLNLDDPEDPTSGQYLLLQFPLNTEAPPDVLFVELWLETAPFDEGAVPYTISLVGDQADLVLCGACTYIAADFTDRNNIDFNMAYSGELLLSALDATPGTGKVTGSLSNIELHDVTISEAGQVTVPDGCLSTIDGVTFDFDVGPAPAP